MHQNIFFQQKLDQLKNNGLYRQPKKLESTNNNHLNLDGKTLLSFCCNDYLGLSQNEDVKGAAHQAIVKYGFGATSSRYIAGNHQLYSKLENKIATIKNTQDAIIFGSGYLSGISTISALMQKGDLIIADKLIHSCLIDGIKLSGAKLLRFKHNDIAHCLKILKRQRQNYQKCLIISETVFSMDGDLGKIPELLDLALKFNCLLLSDDAHGLGIIKQEYHKKHQDIHLQMGTFSKAVGGYGGYVCGPEILIDYLKNMAKSAIYSTALPANIIAGNIKALEIIEKDKILAKKALENAQYFTKLLNLPKSQSCIIVIIIGNIEKTLNISDKITKSGFLISAIRPPTVPQGKSRIRITFNANHKKSDIKKLAHLLEYLEVL